ncbi:MAG TPA: hypothetical protein VGX03_06400 [Candidatus Binatia bacterium]|jgi:hypothetical protein|nr:hypothetical protein [Candidatus Binatia bacterium]
MNFRIELICVRDDGTEERREVLTVAEEQLAMETFGLTLAEGKELLANLQASVVEQQATTYLERHRLCPECGRKHLSKGQGRGTMQTLFGLVTVPNPRWQRCVCQQDGPQSFRPTSQWLTGHTSPELLYLETKWASLIPYAKVADLL